MGRIGDRFYGGSGVIARAPCFIAPFPCTDFRAIIRTAKCSEEGEEVMNISEKLKTLREKKKLTRAEMAKELGVSLKAYSKWENGINEPGKTAIQKLTNYYGEDLIAEISVSDTPAKDGEKAADEKSAPSVPVIVPLDKKLNALRNAKGLTLDQIAEKARVSLYVYRYMEYRNGRPRDIKVYDRLAEVLECDVSYLKEACLSSF